MSRWYAYRRWVYTALVVLLVLDAGVYFGWVQRPPMAPELARAQLAALEREVAERGAEVSRLQRVREQVPHLRPKLDAFTTEWASRPDFPRWLPTFRKRPTRPESVWKRSPTRPGWMSSRQICSAWK